MNAPTFEPGEHQPITLLAQRGCAACTYDMAGLRDTDRCPECGARLDRETFLAWGGPVGLLPRANVSSASLLAAAILLSGGLILPWIMLMLLSSNIKRDYIFGATSFGDRARGGAYWHKWDEVGSVDVSRIQSGSCVVHIRSRRGGTLLRARLVSTKPNAERLRRCLEHRAGTSQPNT